MRKIAKSGLIAAAISIAPPGAAYAQDKPLSEKYERALAAGYKAQFLCSGLWNGGKTVTQVEADELTGIYSRIADIVPTLTADIDTSSRRVTVSFDEDSRPRIAQWTSRSGCSSMPIGLAATSVAEPEAYTRPNFDNQNWPMGDRSAHTPSAAAAKVMELAFTGMAFGKGNKTSAVVITHQGQIVAEKYMPGHNMHTAQRTWSVAKSIAGTLIGASVLRGALDVNQPAAIKQWSNSIDPRKQITVDQLMRMGSGLQSDTAGNRTDAIYAGGSLVTERATGWPVLFKPGSRFRYANNDTLLATLAARNVDQKFDPNALFFKIGMTRTFAEHDWQGNYILSSQVWTTARDMARLGQLYQNDGVWNGERLLPEGWLQYVSKPSGPQPDSQFGYGATFWLMNKSVGIPTDTIAAMGNRGQYLVIIPSLNLTIVRRGYDTRETRFDIEEFTRQMVSAIK